MLNGLVGLGGSIARTLVLRGLELLDGRSVEFLVVQRNQTFVICEVERLLGAGVSALTETDDGLTALALAAGLSLPVVVDSRIF